jgi:predicted RNA binding protein YcfA (HicA-like mRNA interferase family)
MAKVSEIIRKIKKYTNCYIIRHGAEHDVWINPDTGISFTIPRHSSKEVKKGTADSIYKAAGLK